MHSSMRIMSSNQLDWPRDSYITAQGVLVVRLRLFPLFFLFKKEPEPDVTEMAIAKKVLRLVVIVSLFSLSV